MPAEGLKKRTGDIRLSNAVFFPYVSEGIRYNIDQLEALLFEALLTFLYSAITDAGIKGGHKSSSLMILLMGRVGPVCPTGCHHLLYTRAHTQVRPYNT